MRMMCTCRLLEKVLYLWQNLQKKTKNRPKTRKSAHCSPRITTETTNSRNVELGTKVAHGLRMMPKLFVFRLLISWSHDSHYFLIKSFSMQSVVQLLTDLCCTRTRKSEAVQLLTAAVKSTAGSLTAGLS